MNRIVSRVLSSQEENFTCSTHLTEMEQQKPSEFVKERSRRPIRNKRYNRRSFGEEKRPPKRLFTPEIKRFLKDWLVRRRDNPYPNRDEKKTLALQTGLTYIQVCNWFANWRRKLKNAGREPQKQTWGNLIKTYNSQVQGNVEHFSICSEDSIWEEMETNSNYERQLDSKYDYSTGYYTTSEEYEKKYLYKSNSLDHSYISEKTINGSSFPNNNNNNNNQDQCFFVSSTTENDIDQPPFAQNGNKYKHHIMEKYLRDCQKPENQISTLETNGEDAKPSMISKWLESAANFKPSHDSYLNWTLTKTQKKKPKKVENNSFQQHGREELDAAEALTSLAQAYAARNST